MIIIANEDCQDHLLFVIKAGQRRYSMPDVCTNPLPFSWLKLWYINSGSLVIMSGREHSLTPDNYEALFC